MDSLVAAGISASPLWASQSLSSPSTVERSMPTLRFSRRRSVDGEFPEMTLGDVLFRLRVMDMARYHAIDVLARAALKRCWTDENERLLHKDEDR